MYAVYSHNWKKYRFRWLNWKILLKWVTLGANIYDVVRQVGESAICVPFDKNKKKYNNSSKNAANQLNWLGVGGASVEGVSRQREYQTDICRFSYLHLMCLIYVLYFFPSTHIALAGLSMHCLWITANVLLFSRLFPLSQKMIKFFNKFELNDRPYWGVCTRLFTSEYFSADYINKTSCAWMSYILRSRNPHTYEYLRWLIERIDLHTYSIWVTCLFATAHAQFSSFHSRIDWSTDVTAQICHPNYV